MREYGVLNGREADWLWEFDGTPEDYERLQAALTEAARDLSED